MDDLEQKFHQAMLDVYHNALSECNYRATIFFRMVNETGGLKAARQLLWKDEASSGFAKLWECNRLDLTVEAQILSPEFAPPFTDREREIARDRLAQYGYEVETVDISPESTSLRPDTSGPE